MGEVGPPAQGSDPDREAALRRPCCAKSRNGTGPSLFACARTPTSTDSVMPRRHLLRPHCRYRHPPARPEEVRSSRQCPSPARRSAWPEEGRVITFYQPRIRRTGRRHRRVLRRQRKRPPSDGFPAPTPAAYYRALCSLTLGTPSTRASFSLRAMTAPSQQFRSWRGSARRPNTALTEAARANPRPDFPRPPSSRPTACAVRPHGAHTPRAALISCQRRQVQERLCGASPTSPAGRDMPVSNTPSRPERRKAIADWRARS